MCRNCHCSLASSPPQDQSAEGTGAEDLVKGHRTHACLAMDWFPTIGLGQVISRAVEPATTLRCTVPKVQILVTCGCVGFPGISGLDSPMHAWSEERSICFWCHTCWLWSWLSAVKTSLILAWPRMCCESLSLQTKPLRAIPCMWSQACRHGPPTVLAAPVFYPFKQKLRPLKDTQ